MIIRGNNDRYCPVHEVVHTGTRLYEICDYCLQHKYWMYPRTVYYRYGFAKKDVLMCDDCNKIEEKHFKSRLTTYIAQDNAYEAICLTIKEKTLSTSTASSSNSFLLHENNKSSSWGFKSFDEYVSDAVLEGIETEIDGRGSLFDLGGDEDLKKQMLYEKWK